MAYPPARSCMSEFIEGATDGGMRKPTPNRGGFDRSPANTYPTSPMVGVIKGRER